MQRLTAPAVLLVSLLASGVVAAQDTDAASEQQILDQINSLRSAQQLAPLTRDARLDAAARTHSADMAAHQALTHVSEATGTPADRVRAAGVSATTVAENVALHRTGAQAHDALVASEAHRANMLNADVTHVGIAAFPSPAGVYVTEVFATFAPPPAPEAPAAPPPAAPAAPEAPAEPDECVSPIPGVSFCGPLPAPHIQQIEPPPSVQASPAPQIVPQPLPLHPQQVAPGMAGRIVVMQPGSNGTVLLQRLGGRLEGYWVYGSGRWWYYPLPMGARPGMQLRPDMSVSGPPPGYPAHPFAAQPPPPPPRAYPMAQPRPQIVLQQPAGAFYSVPPPPMVGQPDRHWRRAHSRWLRAYRRWHRDQARARRHAL